MGFWDFIASIVGSVAWPAAVFGSVYLFRKELVPLLPRLTVKHKDTVVSFRLDEAEKEAAQLPPRPEALPPPASLEEKSSFLKLAELSPKAAMLETRSEVDEAVRKLTYHFGSPNTSRVSPGMSIRHLQQLNLIGPPLAKLLRDLRLIGNNVAHNPDAMDFSIEEALRYRSLAEAAIETVEAIIHNTPGSGKD